MARQRESNPNIPIKLPGWVVRCARCVAGRSVARGIGAGVLMLALWVVSGCSGCLNPEGLDSYAAHHPPPKAREAFGGDYIPAYTLQDPGDLILLFQRRTQARLDAAVDPAAPPRGRPRFFAVLVNGAPEGHHQTNIFRAAEALKKLGADERNLLILSTGVPWMSLTAYDPAVTPFRVVAKATVTNLKLVMDYLGGVVTTNDVVLLYFTGHGGKVDEYPTLRQAVDIPSATPGFNLNAPSTLDLQGASLSATDFQRHLEVLQRKGSPLIVFLSDECFGDGLVQAVVDTAPRHIAMSITDAYHPTSCRTFAPSFWQAVASREAATQAYPTLKAAYHEAMFQHWKVAGKDWGVGRFCCSDGLDTFSLARLQ